MGGSNATPKTSFIPPTSISASQSCKRIGDTDGTKHRENAKKRRRNYINNNRKIAIKALLAANTQSSQNSGSQVFSPPNSGSIKCTPTPTSSLPSGGIKKKQKIMDITPVLKRLNNNKVLLHLYIYIFLLIY